MIEPGDPVPWLDCRLTGGRPFPLQAAAGRVLVLSYVGAATSTPAKLLLSGFAADEDLYDGVKAQHLVVSFDPKEEVRGELVDRPPGTLHLVDRDRRLARQLGLIDRPANGEPATLRACSLVIDPGLRVFAIVHIQDLAGHAAQVRAQVERALPSPAPERALGGGLAPVLLLPRVLEPELCAFFLQLYDAGRPALSPVQINHPDTGEHLVVDPLRKLRRDITLQEKMHTDLVQDRIRRRVFPEVQRAFQARMTQVERLVLAGYEADDHGWFGPHRDNQGPSSAHRKFACSLSLDSSAYDGGDVWFPEFGQARYRAPSGGALVFSCALLHAVEPVQRGRRICILPFLYDEEGERIRARHYGASGSS